MINLNLIQYQPRWRVWSIALFAKMMGVVVHVEGFPFGSARLRKRRTETETAMGAGESIQRAGSIGDPESKT